MSTLVLHPADPSTDFLKKIYDGIDCDVISDFSDITDEQLKETISEYDRIIMLGHGSEWGLHDNLANRIVVDDSFAEVLRGKILIGIWCRANIYFLVHDLEGFRTGMFISDAEEAGQYGVDAGEDCKDVNASNEMFAKVMNDILKSECSPVLISEEVYNRYQDKSNEVTNANRHFMFS